MSAYVDPETMGITCTQGDTFETRLHILLDDNTEYIPAEGDVIRIAIKSSYSDTEPIVRKIIPSDTLMVRIEADETKRLHARSRPYVYDIELKTPSGFTRTFLAKRLWRSTEEVD